MAASRKEAGPSSERVAANLRRIRRDRELTTAALSQRLAEIGHPIADTGITKIERGQRRVDVDDLMALALALGTTPNRLLLPEVDYGRPGAAAVLTPGGEKVRADDTWAWACGERPLSRKAASFTDDKPAAGELRFIAENRRHYFRGGFGWLGATGDWVSSGVGKGSAPDAGARVKGSGLIVGAILGAFVSYGLDTKDIRQAAESAVAASLVEEEPAAAERALHEVWAWLAAQDDEGEEKEDLGISI